MKILITSYWAPAVGGLWTYVRGLKQGLESMGHQVDVLTRTFGENENYRLNGQPVLKKPELTERIRRQLQEGYASRSLPVSEWILNCEVERYGFEEASAAIGLDRYDLIHAQEVISAGALARTKPEHVPLVTTVHGVWPYEAIFHGYVANKETAEFRYLVLQDRFGVESSDRVILPTRWLQRIMVEEFQVSPRHTTVVPYGLSVEAFQQKLQGGTDAKRPAGNKVITFPSRLSNEKGHAVLLQALAEVKRVRQDFVCWIIGDGELRAELERQCADLELGEVVHFWGTRHDVPALLALADFSVHPSLQDNQPFVVMEAQLAGKALAVSDAGGIPELVEHGKTGLISPAGSVLPLAENILRLLNDESLCRELGENGQRWALDQWSSETMMKRTLNEYEVALRRKKVQRFWQITSTFSTPGDREIHSSDHPVIPDPLFDKLIEEETVRQLTEKPPRGHYESLWDWWDNLTVQEKKAGAHFYKEIYRKVRNNFQLPKGISVKWPYRTLQKSPRAYLACLHKGRVYGSDAVVVTPDHKVLLDVSPSWGEGQEKQPIGKQATLPPLQRLPETVAVLACAGEDDLFHWLYEILPRFELVQKSGVQVDRYLLPSIRHAYQRETLQQLGINEASILEATESLHVEANRLLVPSLPRTSKWATEFVRRAFLHEQKVQKSDGYKRIILSRAGGGERVQGAQQAPDEQWMRLLFEKYGFVVVDMELLSFEQQVQLFSSADVIVSPHGQDLANLAFCQKGTKIIELFSTPVINPRYWVISNYANLNYAYHIVDKWQDQHQSANVEMDLQRITRLLDLM